MTQKKKKISLRYIVLAVLLFVGVLPVLITGWFLSIKSGRELRAVEGRYQTQLVRNKARDIELFGNKYVWLVRKYAGLFAFANDLSALSSVKTQNLITDRLKEDENLVALFVKPVNGKSLSTFRSEKISLEEIEKFSNGVLGRLGENRVITGSPQVLQKSGEILLTFATPVFIDNKIVGAVVAMVSLKGIANIISDKQMSEKELWDTGSPIIFVVDEQGRAIYHPNIEQNTSLRDLKDIKIIEEWTKNNNNVETASLPFSVDYKGERRNMIGEYSTAVINNDLKFGVVVMQDEDIALISVREMRHQTWMISIVLACFVILFGLLLARQLTLPLLNLASAAKKIASGDFSGRISTKSLTEIGTLGHAFNKMGDELEDHIAKLAYAAKENRELFVGTVKALAAAIDGKDHYTRGHSERVSRISVAIGQRLGMDEDELETLRISALLHDIGKIGIDDAILKKPSTLTDEEFEIMKQHPQKGYKIMKNIPAMKDYLPGMYMHHEMVNGKGYPQGLTDEEIPLQAKIVSVADTFDAITIDRPYQKGMQLSDALERIKSFIGTRYDIKVVGALFDACADGQIQIGRVKLKNFKVKNTEKRKPEKIKEVA